MAWPRMGVAAMLQDIRAYAPWAAEIEVWCLTRAHFAASESEGWEDVAYMRQLGRELLPLRA